MTDQINVVIFGGTTEGRELAEFCSRSWTSALVCVAAEPDESVTPELRCVTYRVGRLGREQMAELLTQTSPRIVVDATRPYDTQIAETCAAVCSELGLRNLRVGRPDGVSLEEAEPLITKAVLQG